MLAPLFIVGPAQREHYRSSVKECQPFCSQSRRQGKEVYGGVAVTSAISPFEIYHDRYEAWFVNHKIAYWSELLAIRALTPWTGLGLEIGVGSGRFAAPLGIRIGMDPSPAMLSYAARRGIAAVQGVAEGMPFRNASFDYALNVTTICFLSDVKAALAETYRVLKPSGHLVIGFIDRASALGRRYEAHQSENVFYQAATFYSAGKVADLLEGSGFTEQVWVQTLFHPLSQIHELEPVKPGSGSGAFLVVRATRP
ncbi:class I SAM-dependent methyltransferase [bacterium]|nr:class I SAM-dependent methyltransferase [bacterium]